MKYRKLPIDEKRKIIKEAMKEGNISAVARKQKIPNTMLSNWAADGELNLDKEYVKTRMENKVNVSR